MTLSEDAQTVGIVGAGAWGTALAIAAARAGSRVTLWARDPAFADSLQQTRVNARYLSAITLPADIAVTGDLNMATRCDVLLLAEPAQTLRARARALAPLLSPATVPVICAKGFEQASGALLTDVVEEELPSRPCAVLTGPTFAGEVARGLPAAVTLACADKDVGARLVAALGSKAFRPYLSDDPRGAQVGGAVKNVLAIASGIVAGAGLGDNARAALIARGLAEMMRLGLALGGRSKTLMGLSGLGDLVLTCTSTQSRNYALGMALGEEHDRADALTEGVATAAAVALLAREKKIDMPIAEAVDSVVNHAARVAETVERLLARPFTTEFR